LATLVLPVPSLTLTVLKINDLVDNDSKKTVLKINDLVDNDSKKTAAVFVYYID
jgi:hypothetical protein